MRYWYSYPDLKKKERLKCLLEKHKTISGAASALGCSPYSVKSAIRYHGVAFPT